MRDIPSCDKRNKLKVTDETKYLFYEINMTERQKKTGMWVRHDGRDKKTGMWV